MIFMSRGFYFLYIFLSQLNYLITSRLLCPPRCFGFFIMVFFFVNVKFILTFLYFNKCLIFKIKLCWCFLYTRQQVGGTCKVVRLPSTTFHIDVWNVLKPLIIIFFVNVKLTITFLYFNKCLIFYKNFVHVSYIAPTSERRVQGCPVTKHHFPHWCLKGLEASYLKGWCVC